MALLGLASVGSGATGRATGITFARKSTTFDLVGIDYQIDLIF
jgi:hypothetical protein